MNDTRVRLPLTAVACVSPPATGESIHDRFCCFPPPHARLNIATITTRPHKPCASEEGAHIVLFPPSQQLRFCGSPSVSSSAEQIRPTHSAAVSVVCTVKVSPRSVMMSRHAALTRCIAATALLYIALRSVSIALCSTQCIALRLHCTLRAALSALHSALHSAALIHCRTALHYTVHGAQGHGRDCTSHHHVDSCAVPCAQQPSFGALPARSLSPELFQSCAG